MVTLEQAVNTERWCALSIVNFGPIEGCAAMVVPLSLRDGVSRAFQGPGSCSALGCRRL